MDDREIIQQLKENSEQGLRVLIKKYRGLVGKIASGILTDHEEDVEEVISDTFVNVWRAAERLDSERGSLKGFIVCTARNTALNRLKKLTSEWGYRGDADYGFYEWNIGEEGGTFSGSGMEPDAEQRLILREDSEELYRLILMLEEPGKEIFIRRYFLCENVAEIAKRLNLNTKKVSNYLYRDRLRLKAELKKASKRGVIR